eukprot:TRINITY_DN9565_c0_g1_i1.p2 TRINITY_DN9565_c0_g1~~TRINITY_DN9565_c0_g1_i1.p2  ORF type:complete len:611 (-),score=69.03 TRINITY_DN9565_c0_g1_i1:8-1840(-)
MATRKQRRNSIRQILVRGLQRNPLGYGNSNNQNKNSDKEDSNSDEDSSRKPSLNPQYPYQKQTISPQGGSRNSQIMQQQQQQTIQQQRGSRNSQQILNPQQQQQSQQQIITPQRGSRNSQQILNPQQQQQLQQQIISPQKRGSQNSQYLLAIQQQQLLQQIQSPQRDGRGSQLLLNPETNYNAQTQVSKNSKSTFGFQQYVQQYEEANPNFARIASRPKFKIPPLSLKTLQVTKIIKVQKIEGIEQDTDQAKNSIKPQIKLIDVTNKVRGSLLQGIRIPQEVEAEDSSSNLTPKKIYIQGSKLNKTLIGNLEELEEMLQGQQTMKNNLNLSQNKLEESEIWAKNRLPITDINILSLKKIKHSIKQDNSRKPSSNQGIAEKNILSPRGLQKQSSKATVTRSSDRIDEKSPNQNANNIKNNGRSSASIQAIPSTFSQNYKRDAGSNSHRSQLGRGSNSNVNSKANESKLSISSSDKSDQNKDKTPSSDKDNSNSNQNDESSFDINNPEMKHIDIMSDEDFIVELQYIPKLHQDLGIEGNIYSQDCLLYTSDAADDMQCVDLGGRRIIKKKKNIKTSEYAVNRHEEHRRPNILALNASNAYQQTRLPTHHTQL